MKIPPTFPLNFCFLALATLLLAIGPVRGETDRYVGPIWALLNEKKVMTAAADITQTMYPNCDEATVEEKITEDYRADGTGENQDEAYVKVLTEKGKRDRRTLSIGYMLPYSTAQVVKLEIIKPSGEIVPVDIAANSKETIDTSQMESNIYDPNSKILQVNISGLEINDVLHWVTRTTTLRSIIPGEFADENVFEGDGYIRHLVYEVYAPVDKPLKKIVLKDEVPGTVKYTTEPGGNQTLVHRWEVNNVPRMFSEPSMPPYENVLQRVLVSTTPDWHDVSKWYWNLSKPHLDATSPELKQKVAELTAGATTDMDKIKALFYYVSQKVRYMGLTPEKDRPGFEPHDVCLTFGKNYGVCRDKAGLLVAMLRTAGLNAYPVLVNVGSKKDHEVPDPDFNHAIVSVELKKGEYLLMDPTDEHARDLLPLHDRDQSYLVARPEGEDLQVSAIQPPEQNMMRIKTTGTLTSTGELEAKSELWFDGSNDDVYRNGFSHMKADDVHRYFERCLKKAMPGAQLTSLTVTPDTMLDVSKEIHVELSFSVSGMIATGNGKAVVSVPWIGNDLGVVNFILRGTGLDQRKYPLQTRVACGLDEQISLKLDDGFAGAETLPVCAPVEDDGISYHEKFDLKNGTLDCSRVLKLKVVEFAPAQYAELKQTLKALDYDARKSPVLTMADKLAGAPEAVDSTPATPPVESNAEILNVEKTLTVTDAHTAVYHVKYSKKILTYAGKIREAEVKINYNPACEEATFLHGAVISKSGQRQEIAKGEMNMMDVDWSASAKRYTGGKILVANLPGVDLGSTIEVEYEIKMKNMPFLVGFEAFQVADELQQKSFVVTAPDNIKVETKVTGGGSVPEAQAVTSSAGISSYSWTGKQMKALPAESNLPPDWFFTPGVIFFVGDFKAYLKELNDTLVNRSLSRTKVEEQTKQIISGSTSKLDRVKAIRDFVAKSIRQAGPSFTELPLSELSTADTTLKDGYGHAADRAILLHAMLSAAGFQPEFVLASDLAPITDIQKFATSFSLPDSFTLPLVKLTLDGTTYYLNDTDQYAELGSTPHDDRLGIDLSSQAYETITAAKDRDDRTDTVYTMSLADNGKLRMGITQKFYGGDYNARNRYFSELRPEERKHYFQELVSGVAQGAQAVGDLTTQFESYPGTVQYTVDLDNYAVVDGSYLYFNLPFTPSLFELPGGDQRTLPFMLLNNEKMRTRTEIELPPGFQGVVIAPKSDCLQAPAGAGTAQMSSTTTTGQFTQTDDFEISPAIIAPEEYPALLKVESALEKKSARVFLLQKDK
jgi:transglutaminase-like putative cysteine protease